MRLVLGTLLRLNDLKEVIQRNRLGVILLQRLPVSQLGGGGGVNQCGQPRPRDESCKNRTSRNVKKIVTFTRDAIQTSVDEEGGGCLQNGRSWTRGVQKVSFSSDVLDG